MSKKIDIYKDQHTLEITIDWYSSKAWPLLFFSIFWNGFLIIWWILAISGGDTSMLLVSLLHVAAGIGISYYTLCLFINKSYVDIRNGRLTVLHKPMPWRGNKSILTQDIKQLYVKEKAANSEKGTKYTYQLRAKLNGGKDEKILSLDEMPSRQVKGLERQLEDYMGIQHYPVPGEFGNIGCQSNLSTPSVANPRKQQRDFSPSDFTYLYFSQKRDFITFKEKELEVISSTQYDWNEGNSDKLFQLISEEGEETLLYIIQNKALLSVYEEEVLGITAANGISFQKDNVPNIVEIEEKAYHLTQFSIGEKFLHGVSPSIKVQQWLYVSKDKKEHIRIVDNKGSIVFNKGIKRKESDFESSLDLHDLPPMKEIRYDEPNWTDEDLV